MRRLLAVLLVAGLGLSLPAVAALEKAQASGR